MSAQIAHERGYEPAREVTAPRSAGASRASGWGAVFALTLCVATLIASEFMPVSLLTPIATDLHTSGGRAGRAIAVSGLFAVLTSLGISSATRGIDRRRVLLWLTILMLLSGMMVADWMEHVSDTQYTGGASSR
jgi:predicted MFS family arabinose efflux permease